ncbi:helix-turn-helix domain-containing protein [Chloroflexota bacterium]
MIVRTRIFEFRNNSNKNLSELAQAMGISVSQIYRVREGTRQINQKFIVGAIKAFPNYKLDDLFYLVPGLPNVNSEHRYQHSAIPSTRRPVAQKEMSTGERVAKETPQLQSSSISA